MFGRSFTIRRGKDPAVFARSILATNKPRENLLRNGKFATAQAKDDAPDGWFTWQDDHSHGVIACADGRVTISNAGEAVVGMIAETTPGSQLAARLRVRSTGRGQGRWPSAGRQATENGLPTPTA